MSESTQSRKLITERELEHMTKVHPNLKQIEKTLSPAENELLQLCDNRTNANYVECHIKAQKIIQYGTTSVPLDPSTQKDYKANREVVVNAEAFTKMKEDALGRRSFSDIVCEYSSDKKDKKPLKVIGGQHRFEAINLALNDGIDELHGVKIYYALTKTQRLDVQLISNTNIAVSSDLYDRMNETHRGPQLRDWCQMVGLLAKNTDFTDKRTRATAISVQVARTFILNFYRGKAILPKSFDGVDTTPIISKKGKTDAEWESFLVKYSQFEKELDLNEAGKEFVKLAQAQRKYFETKTKTPIDYKEKAMNLPLLAGWAFVAGCLQGNKKRLRSHYKLKVTKNHDPLNATVLAKGRHKSDPALYRGLGVRTDAKECGRFAELFFSQAEYGAGIDTKRVDVAIKKYHAKQAVLEAKRAEK